MSATALHQVDRPWRVIFGIGIFVTAIAVVAMIVWQGITAHGAPDPTQPNTSPTVAFLDIGILVFREGLECILVLAAITASMTGPKRAHRKPVAAGAGVAFGATLITWFIAVRIVDSLSDNMRALDLQAATGLLAVVVLLVIMNWFFHKIYWGGWIRAHNRRRKALVENGHEIGKQSLLWGLILLGFTSLYREGFEVVLFLQSYNLRLGGGVVLKGALLGIALSAMVAVLTFILQQRLPYRKMLITTGVLLGVVLLVMVGEQAQEMQLAHWISTTPIAWLLGVPDLRNPDRAIHRRGSGDRFLLCGATFRRQSGDRRACSRGESRSRYCSSATTIGASALIRDEAKL